MKLIVGLGNPGEEYESTRHNAGFMLLDELAKLNNLSFEKDKYTNSFVAKNDSYVFAKPQTFMNSSGEAVALLMKRYSIKAQDLYIVHDDLDLKLGEYKKQLGVGPKVHNGITSIEESIKNTEFWRVRIGIDNRDPINRIPGEEYVLQKFLSDELFTLDKTLETVSKAL